ncbi:complement C3-like isoform X1 [Xiphophorus maculatus]|uniref:complement C3-like isoform X1 n=1 Tax=Xiphophorus maculatus TaxID=8083 RepID=UPI000C6CA7DB|nr:complement C3-like isoform X1 [Xiphophorus maculatus]
MGSMMGISALQLLLVAFSCLTSQSSAFPLKVLSAPNLLRVGATENIFVEIQDCESEAEVPVEIAAWSFPTKAKKLASTPVRLTKKGNFQGLGRITIPADEFEIDSKRKQYVYLQADFGDHLLERVVLVSFEPGYIFIQTDKTIYTPNSNVNYRLFAIRPGMEPVERASQSEADALINIQIVTPDGAILQSTFFVMNSQIHSGMYQLGELVSPGIWKVIAKFSTSTQSFVSEFEVKEYVLPSFEVEVKPLQPCFYVDSKELKFNIEATYTFGKKVDGSAYVVFGVMHENQKKSISDSLQRIPITEGQGEAKITRENINTIKDVNSLVGETIFIKASVLTENGGELVEVELGGIKIVTSPYTISFKKTPRYFKPGVSFDVTIEVLNPDESPAKGVAVVVDPGSVSGLTGASGLARLTINTVASSDPLLITARTNVPQIPYERQASVNMTAYPYQHESSNYIHIGLDTTLLKLGTNMKINLYFKGQDKHCDITCLVFSRGQLVQYKRHRRESQSLITMILPITKEMLPSFRLVAYFHPTPQEVVSDSVWVDVEDTCMGSLTLSSNKKSYLPREKGMLELKITGDPGAKVGLVAVDKGVYILNNKYRLTQKKIWDVVEQYDTGCSPGGGNNSRNVFNDAGLLFKTNTAFETPYRTDLKCESHHRQKRAASISEVISKLANTYNATEKLKRECCLDGMKDIPVAYTCERRSNYISDGPDCVAAFLHCCNEMQKEQAKRREEILHLARSEVDDYHMSNIITTRSKFPESWLWYDITLPGCPRDDPDCVSTTFRKKYALPDSITTWQLTGISLSNTHGICVAEPLEVIVEKTFFIDLRLPYSAVHGEQLEVKVILHNYNDEPVSVRVDLLEEKDVCSAAFKRRRFQQMVRVGAQTTRAVPFIIIPMKEGEVKITVKAAITDSETGLSDGIERKLRVVPRGVLKKSIRNVLLAPAEKGVSGRQDETINSEIPQTEFVPNTPLNTHIFVTGREQMSSLLENAISGKSMGTLIRAPGGCGEQNMISMTLPVIATLYLDKTNQWEDVGFQKRAEALQHINTGYKNEFAYRKNDGGFAVFPDRPSGTWLTAYVAKVFAIAHGLVKVDSNVICKAIQFLILKAKNPAGMYKEVGDMIHFEMIGDVAGRDSDASMTAFCLIAMQESRSICSDIPHLNYIIYQSVTYLQSRLPQLTNPYAVAITSYALANENKLNKDILYQFAAPDKSHWPSSTTHENTLEATAYALLALVNNRSFTEAKPIVRWLSQQQKSEGGYGSTQATIMVYQAVAEYWANAEESKYDLNVDISLPGRSNLLKYHFLKESHYSTKSDKFTGVNKDVNITATGTGEATLKMVSFYYAIPKEEANDCTKFNLTVELAAESNNDEQSTYKLTLTYFFKSRERSATMSILDIGLPTGFSFDKEDLDKMSKGPSRLFSKYEFDKLLSDKGSLIIYLDRVSNKQPEMISFRIHQEIKVGVLQPAAVSLYEYYDRKPCKKFYRPGRESGELLRLCQGHVCTCAEENCSMQRKEKINNHERTEKACEVSSTHKIDFVYKARVEGFADSWSTDIFTVRIVEVIKQGTDKKSEGNLRKFLSYHHCRDALDLIVGQTYLIMGSSRDIHIDDQNQQFQYVLGENTWIEYWPSAEECQMGKHQSTCSGLNTLVQQLQTSRCRMK